MDVKRKERPDKRGKSSVRKKFENKAQGRRVGQLDERGNMKDRQCELPHVWQRVRQWYLLESAKGRGESI